MPQRLESLKEVIINTVNPDAWRDAGGTVGSISTFKSKFVIIATPKMHEQIEALLTLLREDSSPARRSR